MIRINQVKLPVEHTTEALHKKVQELLKYKGSMDVEIVKRSLDARKKPQLFYVYMLDVTIPEKEERKLLKRCRSSQIQKVEPVKYVFPVKHYEGQKRPVIVGMGPAGLFCGYVLAKAGFRPILLERGKCVEERSRDVEAFWKTGHLNTESNVQFGEGGAGTFSDGKLNTLIKDKYGRNKEVLRIFVKHGAPKEILYDYKPHIGTDILKKIVRSMREEILASGGDVRFETRVTDLLIADGRIKGLVLNGQEELLAEHVVLALGHSARDTFSMLLKQKIVMEPKPFAIGMRVEHPQELIDQIQYHRKEGRGKYLPAAEYSFVTQANNRGVYSFCMCPGGYVVNASSEEGRLAVNGMSYQARDSHNANSAIIVTVNPSDFPEEGVLGGIALQRKLERAAWEAGKGKIPVQLFKDYCTHQKSTRLGDVIPCIKGAYTLTDVRSIFPKEIGDSIEAGIHAFGKKLSGFDRPDALLEGVESRTSSPVRIVREPKKLTSNIEGIYPCGEGAGYAGGITSAAMDGIKVAEAVASVYALPVNKM